MSVQAMSWVIAYAAVGGSELLVLLMVANHAHADGTGAYPGEKLLATETRMSQRQVRRLLHQLVDSGQLRVEVERSHLKTKVYCIAGMTPDNLSDVTPDRSDSRPDISAITPDKSVIKPDIAVSAKPFKRQEPSVNRSTRRKVERPVFDGRNLYRYHAALIGFQTSTPGQRDLIDKYVALAAGDYALVAKAMKMTENPRRRNRLSEVGDMVAEVMKTRLSRAA